MLFFLVSFFPFVVLLSKSLPMEPLPPWASETRLVSILLFQEVLLSFLAPFLERCRPVRAGNPTLPSSMKGRPHRVENVEEEMSLLDLPELSLDCILGRLSPAGLCNMAAVCSSLKERCRSDHLWEKHLKKKWGRVIGNAARREWKLYLASSTRDSAVGAEDFNRSKKWTGVLSCLWPFSWLNCRYPPHGRRMMIIEEGVQWDRLRAPPVTPPAYDLHISDCLSDLRAGDHIEIQWRRNKEFPYEWDSRIMFDGSLFDVSDTVILEFNQYTPGSRWRRASINRKAHREEGNETDGFYGGIRKLQSKDEISKWRQLWPKDVLV
ncbi:hypothetical protein BHE74_00013136 [Ensete ventricosum]|nr:hypothetical protein BHE74_00013136 [Ensete ventricosum]